jgi:hypothetical protein
MDMRTLTSAIFLACLVSTAWSQLPAPNAAGVSMGHAREVTVGGRGPGPAACPIHLLFS